MSLNNGLTLKLDELRLTASVINSPEAKGDVEVPSIISRAGNKYVINSISEDAFLNNQSINSLKFANDSQLLIIHKNAFAFSSLQNLFIPKSLTILKEGWCLNANNLRSIEVSPKNRYFNFIDNELLISKDGKTIYFAQKDIEKIEIPTTVKTISSLAFSRCSNLRFINFYKLSDLSHESKIIPIYPTKFLNLYSIDPFSNEIKEQPDYFKKHESSHNTNNDEEITTLGESAFKPIKDLLPFHYMSIALTARATIASAMAEKSKSRNSEIEDENLDDSDIKQNTEDDDSITGNNKNPKNAFDDDIQENNLIDTDLEELGEYSFSDCTSLIAIRAIPASVKKVGCYCFSGNTSLRSVEFLSTDISVGNNVFQGCISLESVSFPNAQKLLFDSMTFDGLTNTISLYIFPGAYVKVI